MSLNVAIIKESFEQAKPIADQIADKFYEFLWTDYPVSKTLFEDTNMKQQKKALINSLVFIVDKVDQPDKLVPYLQQMGARHTSYGTQNEHYEWVGNTLLKTFAHFFGENWTEELQAEWTKAYIFIANTMQDGAANQVPAVADLRERAKNICENLLKEVLEEKVDEEFEQYVRAKVRKILFKILEEESEQIFQKSA